MATTRAPKDYTENQADPNAFAKDYFGEDNWQGHATDPGSVDQFVADDTRPTTPLWKFIAAMAAAGTGGQLAANAFLPGAAAAYNGAFGIPAVAGSAGAPAALGGGGATNSTAAGGTRGAGTSFGPGAVSGGVGGGAGGGSASAAGGGAARRQSVESRSDKARSGYLSTIAPHAGHRLRR